MSLRLRTPLIGAMRDGRRSHGLTKERVAGLIGSGRKAKPSPQWSEVSESPFFLALSERSGRDRVDVILDYLRAVARRLPDQQRVVVDWILSLRLVENRSYPEGLETRRMEARRELRNLQVPQPRFASIPAADSTYREKVEDPSIDDFADLLDQPQPSDIVEMGLDPNDFSQFFVPDPAPGPGDSIKAVVLGGAVMDLNVRIPGVPDVGASVQALSLKPFPGGKGLTQAVACARLGIETKLISVVGGVGDVYSDEIMTFLAQERVDTSLIARRDDEGSPVTIVVTLDRSGGTFAIGWKNEQNLFFSPNDIAEEDRVQAIQECQYFLTSFELPSSTVGKALSIAKKAGATTIVTPAPPYQESLIDASHYKQIDYLVANTWELAEFARLTHVIPQDRSEIDGMARPVVTRGLSNLLVVHERQCHAYVSEGSGRSRASKEFSVPGWPTKESESAGDRDAFCAMLAKQLHTNAVSGGSIDRAVYWGTAAMARAGGGVSVPDSMPYYDQVADLISDGHIEIPD